MSEDRKEDLVLSTTVSLSLLLQLGGSALLQKVRPQNPKGDKPIHKILISIKKSSFPFYVSVSILLFNIGRPWSWTDQLSQTQYALSEKTLHFFVAIANDISVSNGCSTEVMEQMTELTILEVDICGSRHTWHSIPVIRPERILLTIWVPSRFSYRGLGLLSISTGICQKWSLFQMKKKRKG